MRRTWQQARALAGRESTRQATAGQRELLQFLRKIFATISLDRMVVAPSSGGIHFQSDTIESRLDRDPQQRQLACILKCLVLLWQSLNATLAFICTYFKLQESIKIYLPRLLLPRLLHVSTLPLWKYAELSTSTDPCGLPLLPKFPWNLVRRDSLTFSIHGSSWPCR